MRFGWLGIMIVVWLTGCATQATSYPEFQAGKSIFVSGGTISTLTETPAGDYLVPNSQVFLSRNDVSIKGSGAGALFGVVGAMAAVSNARDASKSSFGNAGNKMSIRFDALVTELLQRQVLDLEKIRIVSDEEASKITMVPFARFSMGSDGIATVVFQINVRFFEKSTGKGGKKAYAHGTMESRKMEGDGGWLEGGATHLNAAALVAFDRLVKVALMDIDGKLLSGETMPKFEGFSLTQPVPNYLVLFERPGVP